MNKQERRVLGEFPVGLDEAVSVKFGVVCETSFNIFSFPHVTTFSECDEKKTAEINLFIEGFMAGNQELSNRLYHDN